MSKDEKPVIEIVNNLFNDDLDPSRQVMERVWYRNILYSIGEQYLQWSMSRHSFRRKTSKMEEPTPVDNIIRDYVRSMKAMILNKNYTVRVWPNSNSYDDIMASKTADFLLKHMETDNDDAFADERERVAIWMVLFGTSFMRVFPEKSGGEWAILKNGKLLTTGDVGVEAWMPFNVEVDSYGDTLKKKRFVGMKSLKPKEWVEDTFGKTVETGDDHRIIDYQKRLMRMVADVSPWKGAGLSRSGTFDMADEDLVVFKEVEFRPTKTRPDGRYVVAVGDKILHDKNIMPIPAEKGEWYYTLTDFHYHNVPGRFWSDSGVNDQIPHQDSINKIDQKLQMNRDGVGRPMLTMPGGMKLKRMNEGGQSMIVIEYDGMMSSQRPEISRGVALPEQVLAERMIHIAAAQDAGGDPKGVLKGKSPGSQASGTMVDTLREAAEQGHTPDVERFYRKIKAVKKKQLVLAKHIMTEDRTLKILGPGKSLQIKKFKASDLRNNTDVRLELDSSISTTNAGKGQMMSEMAKSGAFNEDSKIPTDVMHELMTKVGLTGLKDKANIHIERTELENARIFCATKSDIKDIPIDGRNVKNGSIPVMTDIFISAPMPVMDETGQPVMDETGKPIIEDEVFSEDHLFKLEDHGLCKEYHLKFILSPEFKDIYPKAQVVAVMHYDAHNLAEKMQQEEAMQKMAMAKQMESGQPAQQPTA